MQKTRNDCAEWKQPSRKGQAMPHLHSMAEDGFLEEVRLKLTAEARTQPGEHKAYRTAFQAEGSKVPRLWGRKNLHAPTMSQG